MTDTAVGPFEVYIPLFWRVLAELAADGYVAPPNEVGDLIHGFYAGHWEGVRRNYDPHRGSFRAYVSGAFYRFARREISRQRAWRKQLADVRSLDLRAGPGPDPAEAAARGDELRTIRTALERLPRSQRDLLLEFLALERPSERELARKHSLTRHRVREALTDALGRVATEFEREALRGTADGRVALALWDLGWSVGDTAARLGLTVAEVRAIRRRMFQRLVALLRGRPGEKEHTTRGKATMTESERDLDFMTESERDLDLFKACLLNPGSSELMARVRERAPAILRAMEEDQGSGRFELTDQEVNRIEFEPEWAAQVYGLLGAASEALEEGQEIRQAIEAMRTSEAEATAAAFDVLMDTLPPRFAGWPDWFSDLPPALADEQAALADLVEVRQAGPHARGLIVFGMTPATLAGAARSVELLADRLIVQARSDENAWPDHPVMVPLWRALRERAESDPRPSLDLPLGLAEREGGAVVPYPLLLAQVRGTPGCPPEAAPHLLNWMVQVAHEKPFFFPGYTAQPVGHVLRLTEDLDRSGHDLTKRWSHSVGGPVLVGT